MIELFKDLSYEENLNLLGMVDSLTLERQINLKAVLVALEAGYVSATTVTEKEKVLKLSDVIVKEKVNFINFLKLGGYNYLAKMKKQNEKEAGVMI